MFAERYSILHVTSVKLNTVLLLQMAGDRDCYFYFQGGHGEKTWIHINWSREGVSVKHWAWHLGCMLVPGGHCRKHFRAHGRPFPPRLGESPPPSPALRLQRLFWKTAMNLQVNRHFQSTRTCITKRRLSTSAFPMVGPCWARPSILRQYLHHLEEEPGLQLSESFGN